MKFEFGLIIDSLFFIVFGLVMLFFHKRVGESSTRFQESIISKLINDDFEFGKMIKEIVNSGYLVMGIIITLFGILLFLQKIPLR